MDKDSADDSSLFSTISPRDNSAHANLEIESETSSSGRGVTHSQAEASAEWPEKPTELSKTEDVSATKKNDDSKKATFHPLSLVKLSKYSSQRQVTNNPSLSVANQNSEPHVYANDTASRQSVAGHSAVCFETADGQDHIVALEDGDRTSLDSAGHFHTYLQQRHYEEDLSLYSGYSVHSAGGGQGRKRLSHTTDSQNIEESRTVRRDKGGIVEMVGEDGNGKYLLEAHVGDFRVVDTAENELEARKIYNNYAFGLRKWKSHVTSRPISTRSQVVQDLYSDVKTIKPVTVSTLRISNIIYTLLIGWWLAGIYALIGCLVYITFVGREYGRMCFRLSKYFFWPFGKFVHQYHKVSLQSVASEMSASISSATSGQGQSLTKINRSKSYEVSDEMAHLIKKSTPRVSFLPANIWRKPSFYVWLVFGVPVLTLTHGVIVAATWFFVLTIPIAKINLKAISKIMFTSPDELQIGDSSIGIRNSLDRHSEIIMYTHQSFNFYYFKYTVDGVNVILANLLVFVILSIVLGYADEENVIISPITKCVLSILAILPVTYYIGMAITSISAQSSFAVGAIMNATFGSMVEVILFIIMLKKGKDQGETCYQELVKSTLTGSILCCILLVPGLSMVVGGMKYRKQNFNPKSANISSSLLFVAIIGVFAPTIFSKIYGNLECDQCEDYTKPNTTTDANMTGFLCTGCRTVIVGIHHSNSLYHAHVKPLLYVCAVILPLSYIIGLIFFMKTHSADIFEDFENKQKEEGAKGHGHAQWSRPKSAIILLISATAIALAADLIATNIAPLLNATGLSEYFVGVTLLSIVSMLPEIVNGTQFALQNNVNLGIEIGSAAAIQVCMVQLPIIVFAELIYPMGFNAVFNDIHLWAIIFAVIIINYVFQDGKSDYFQGSIVMFIYILLMAMYLFTVTPDTAVCKKA